MLKMRHKSQYFAKKLARMENIAYLCSNKTNIEGNMDIKAVIQSRGYQVQELAKKMKIKQGTLSGMITGNPTVKSLNLIAKALNCSVAEFFLDELPADFDLAAWREQMAAVQKPQSDADQLPFGQEQEPEATPGVFVCPHCGAGVSFSAFVVKEPSEEKEESDEQK